MSSPGRTSAILKASRPPKVYLHIGAMKTGTTFLQELMSANKQSLADAGYLFPGDTWTDQDRAARDVLGFSSDDARLRAQSEGMWQRLTEQMLAHDGAASIYSMEFLSFADAEQAARIVASFPGAELHVVLTVRDAGVAIPAQWQTGCRNAATVPWPKFVAGARQVLESDEPAQSRGARRFQRTQGIPRMLEVWTPLVGSDRLHVVTVPPRGSDPLLLWERFAGVVGVDPAVCSTELDSANASLGHASTELLRLVNIELGKVPRSDYDRVVKSRLARDVLGNRSHLESPIVLHRPGRRVAARWNAVVRSAIETHGVRVVGDLDDLPVGPPDPSTPAKLGRPTVEELLEAAATARDGLTGSLQALTAKASSPVGSQPPSPDPADTATETDPGRWRGDPTPVRAAVREVTELVRSCIELLHELDAREPDAPEAH